MEPPHSRFPIQFGQKLGGRLAGGGFRKVVRVPMAVPGGGVYWESLKGGSQMGA